MMAQSPVACASPVRTAVPLPRFLSCRRSFTLPIFSKSLRISRVPSVEQSSTAIISLPNAPMSAFRIAEKISDQRNYAGDYFCHVKPDNRGDACRDFDKFGYGNDCGAVYKEANSDNGQKKMQFVKNFEDACKAGVSLRRADGAAFTFGAGISTKMAVAAKGPEFIQAIDNQ